MFATGILTAGLRSIIVSTMAACAIVVPAATQTNVVVNGTWRETDASGFDETGKFTCRGAPTCNGTFSTSTRLVANCNNLVTLSGTFAVTGLNLAASGPIQGTITFVGLEDSWTRNPDGTCVVLTTNTQSVNYAGTWDRTLGSGSFTTVGVPNLIMFEFTATFDAPARSHNGTTVTKQISRQVFSGPVSACQ